MHSNTEQAASAPAFQRVVARMSRRSPLSEVQAAKWASIRRRGRRRYIFLSGVLRWGVGIAVPTTIVAGWLGAPAPFLGRLAIALVVYPLIGIGYGAWMWSFNERRYSEWIDKRDGQQPASPPNDLLIPHS
jgi:hypothetical protein